MANTKDRSHRAKKKQPEKIVTLKYNAASFKKLLLASNADDSALDQSQSQSRPQSQHHPTAHHDPSFLGLPLAIRSAIYDYLFDNVLLYIDWQRETDSALVSWEHDGPHARWPLRVNRQTRAEAMPVLYRNVRLVVVTDVLRKAYPVCLSVRHQWLACVRNVSYECTPRLRLDWALFKSLERITLTPKIYHCVESELEVHEDGDQDDGGDGKAEASRVKKLVRSKVISKNEWLFHNKVLGLTRDDGIEVTMTVWLINERHQSEEGWAVEVDVRH